MSRIAVLALAVGLALAPVATFAQSAGKSTAPATVKAGKDEKVCNYRFVSGPSKGAKRSWVCKKEQPCCAWDEISYVKCGSTITGCF